MKKVRPFTEKRVKKIRQDLEDGSREQFKKLEEAQRGTVSDIVLGCMTKKQIVMLENSIKWLETFVKNGGTSAYVNAALSRLEDLRRSERK